MLNKLILVSILGVSLLVTSCSNTVYKPSVMEEYEQPYILSQTHQALPVGVTQQTLEQTSDVVIIKPDSEFVYWTPTAPSLVMNNPLPEIESHIVEEIYVKPIVSEQPERTCKKIYCDSENKSECGAIAWCGDDYCPKDKQLDEFYDCSGKQCVVRWVNETVFDSDDCSDPSLALHHECLGKGEQACAGHQELFYCNNLARECTEN